MQTELKNKKPKLITQADAVIYFLQNLDVDMVGDILEDNRSYQDFEKHVFIRKLGYALDEFILAGDTFLNRYNGICNSVICNYKCKGYTFIGNNSDNYFDLIIDIKDGIIQDIYECTYFKAHKMGLSKGIRIKIDKY